MDCCRVAVFGYWRTGTNLFIDIFQKAGYFNFGEYFGHTMGYIKSTVTNTQYEFLKNDLNAYYRLLSDFHNVKRSIIKIMFPHTDMVDTQTFKCFDFNFLIHRVDFKQVIISKIIAENRQSWTNDGQSHQPKFDYVISTDLFDSNIESFIDVYRNYLDLKTRIDCVVDYDVDLVPYIKDNPSYLLKSDNYTVRNMDEIGETYRKYLPAIKSICDKVDILKSQTKSFRQSINYLTYK